MKQRGVIRGARVAGALVLALAGTPPGDAVSQEPASIRGAWRPTTYVLKNGARHPLDGLIVFTASDWSVLFFVLDAWGRPRRGSGEGGSYTLDANRLVFTHRFNLAAGRAMEGLDASPLSMVVREAAGAPTEPSTIELTGDQLVIAFPSGNRMEFRRSSAPD